jgi:NAD-dependent deacetylase
MISSRATKGIYMDLLYEEVVRLMVDLKPSVALTGAGISAESGIPTFRSKGGLWEKYDPMIYASIEAFREGPSKYRYGPISRRNQKD